MKSVHKWAAMILGTSLFFTACGGPSSPTASPDGKLFSQEEGPVATTLVVAIGKDPQELDPATSYDMTQDYVVSTLFDGLTRYKPGTLEIEPGLAESWDISSDGLTYTFHLRKGVQFHDGAPLNAGAVVQWMDRLLNPQSPYYHKKRRNAYSSVAFDAFFHVVAYEAVDDDTFVLKLEEPVPSLLQELAHPRAGITSPAADERYGLDIGRHPVGTGPYRLVEWEPEEHIRLAANPHYWGGAPAIPELVFRVVPDSSAGLGLLRDGEVHILADVNWADVDSLKDDPQIKILSVPGPFQLFLSLPVERPPFSDRRVRQALNHAVDKDDLNRRLYRGLAQPMTAPLPSAVWGHSGSLQPYDYDLEKARRLLAEAGYPDGFE
ncbi:MAG: ABC transporter substrate-binding protein, partial [Clostridiales bacterium]|nr:ABC transporter substrate-binding protein [Clostridiales bacterium]